MKQSGRSKTVFGAEISHGCLGAITELRICADLIGRGWKVFRAVSPSSPCDLVGIKPSGEIKRIECTQARYDATGKVRFCPHDPARYDIICGAVKETGELVYSETV